MTWREAGLEELQRQQEGTSDNVAEGPDKVLRSQMMAHALLRHNKSVALQGTVCTSCQIVPVPVLLAQRSAQLPASSNIRVSDSTWCSWRVDFPSTHTHFPTEVLGNITASAGASGRLVIKVQSWMDVIAKKYGATAPR